jgi:Zn-dependent protease with chaperone function
MYELLAICLSLTGLLLINSVGSMLTSLLGRLCRRHMESKPAQIRAQFLFLLRLLPPVAAILGVGTLFIPAYLANEPRQTDEVVTVKLGILAALSLYAISAAVWHGLTARRLTMRLTRDWMKHSEQVRIGTIGIPTFRIRHPFPLIAVVGTWRPKLFIAEQIFASLTPHELLAAIAHEEGHLITGDNFKRAVLSACRNSLILKSMSRTFDRKWVETTELAADEYAARNGAAMALDLASALVKVARLVPRDATPAMFAGANLVADEMGSIQKRVLRLTQIAAHPGNFPSNAGSPA